MSGAGRAASRLDALLLEQRQALREGRFERLTSVAERLERSIAAREPGLTAPDAARLRRLAAENAQLLRAAMQGLAEARHLRQGSQGTPLSTYDASGRLMSQTGSGRTLGRR